MKKYKLLSIIIPVFNEESFIQTVIEKVIKADSLGLQKELIITNDGSTDETLSKLKSKILDIKSKHKVVIIDHKRNEGKGISLKEGFLKSTGYIVLIQDADLEYDPENYVQLLKPFIKYHVDAVYGSRFVSQHPHRVLYFWHFLGNFFLTTLSNLCTNLNLTDMETGYKVFKGDLIRKIAPKLQSKRFGFEPEITARISKIRDLKLYEVGISYFGRTYNEGKKIGWKDGIKAIWEIIRYNFLDLG